jgi:hypothetical protein
MDIWIQRLLGAQYALVELLWSNALFHKKGYACLVPTITTARSKSKTIPEI